MRTAVVAGGSGLVGGFLLQGLLESEAFGRVVSLGRRRLPLASPKLDQAVVDFGDAKALEAAMPPEVDDAFCCLGTTRKAAGSAQAFYAVDFTACLHFAQAARARGAKRFLLVSSLGADERSFVFYSRVKGETEQAVQGLGFEQVHLLRPSILDGDRQEHRLGERVGLSVMRAAFGVLGRTRRYAPIHARTVAAAMVRLALEGAPGAHVHPSEELQRLGGGSSAVAS